MLPYKDGLPSDAGTYSVKASIAAQGNYAAAKSTNDLTLTIKPTPVTLTFANQTITYGDAPTPATANPTSAEIRSGPLILTASPVSPLIGGGMVTLTLSGLPSGGSATVTCSGGITVTAGAGNTWTATLPNSTATYTFTASYEGSATHHAASASCIVETKEVVTITHLPGYMLHQRIQLLRCQLAQHSPP